MVGGSLLYGLPLVGLPTIYIYIYTYIYKSKDGPWAFLTGFRHKGLLFFGSSWHFNISYINLQERKTVKEFA